MDRYRDSTPAAAGGVGQTLIARVNFMPHCISDGTKLILKKKIETNEADFDEADQSRTSAKPAIDPLGNQLTCLGRPRDGLGRAFVVASTCSWA